MIRKINGEFTRIVSGTAESGLILPTALTLMNYIFIAGNVIKVGDVLTLRAAILKTGTTNSYVIRLYWNTLYTTSGATQLGVYTIPTTARHVQFYRRIHFSSSSAGKSLNTTFNTQNDMGDSATTMSTTSITNWLTSDGFFFLTVDAGGARLTDSIQTIYLSGEI